MREIMKKEYDFSKGKRGRNRADVFGKDADNNTPR